MVERHPWLDRLNIVGLIFGVVILCFPIYYTIIAASLPLEDALKMPMPLQPGGELWNNLIAAWSKGDLARQMWNSFIMAMGITIGKIVISMLSAFAITYFNFRIRQISFWLIFVTLMLPVEVRILPTYEVAANAFAPLSALFRLIGVEMKLNWSLLDSYSGLTLPLIASATATFLFRQFFLTVPDELCEAAKIDGASPMQFFRKVLLPLSRTNIAALFVITFVYGWNQYLWPLLITTKPEMKTAIMGVQSMIPKADEIPEWNTAMAASLIVMIPPILVVILMQRWFVKGLVEKEK